MPLSYRLLECRLPQNPHSLKSKSPTWDAGSGDAMVQNADKGTIIFIRSSPVWACGKRKFHGSDVELCGLLLGLRVQVLTQRLESSSFWVMTYLLLRDYYLLHKKELHSSLWVGTGIRTWYTEHGVSFTANLAWCTHPGHLEGHQKT